MLSLKIDTRIRHAISPYLYMQFMEPLGVCDASVDAAWNFMENDWYAPVIDAVRDLGPGMIRFGGCFASYYRWQEGVGPMTSRVPMLNQLWGGLYHNRVGTHEFADFCRRVGAEPLIVVNMESDGRMHWAYPPNGDDRFGTAEEAAAWVRYCNAPDDPLRISHGHDAPYSVRWWQIGNETSYDRRGYSLDRAYDATCRFAAAMKEADPSVRLIAWADSGPYAENWTAKMAGIDEADLLAFHHHFDSGLPDSPLTGTEYRRDPDKTWLHLMHAHKSMEAAIDRMRAHRGTKRLAMTEGHYALPGRNRNEVLSSWAAGVSYARCHNVIHRSSDVLDIATMADFFGSVWQVNAMMIPTPMDNNRKPYLQPVGAVMRLFGRYQGEYALDVSSVGAVDITASRTGDTVYLHLVNTDMHASQILLPDLGGIVPAAIRIHQIAADPTCEITPVNPDCFAVEDAASADGAIRLSPAAVAAVEIDLPRA